MSGERDGWTLYVIDLKKTVINDRRFRAANPHYRVGKPCVYVGLTVWTAEKRFQQHVGGVHSARIPRKFGKRVRESTRLRPMSRRRAEKKEAAKAQFLRTRGWGVWSH